MKTRNQMTKAERRRLLFNRNYEMSAKNRANYGAEHGAAVVVGKTVDFNRKVIAAILALVFVLTSVIVGFNIVGRAEEVDGYKMYETSDSNFVTRKGLKYDEATDTYALRMEAYATDPITSKFLDAKTPLDVVLLMDEASLMGTKDVLTGEYSVIENKSTYSISEAEGKYYKVSDDKGDHYYEVFAERSPNEEDYVVVKDDNDEIIEAWTAQDAHDKSQELNQDLYFKIGDDFETVRASQEIWYKNAGSSISPADFDTTHSWYYNINHPMRNTYYYSIASESEHPSWRQVYMNYRGVLNDGYYYYLWYYTEDVPSVTISKADNTLNNTNWGTTFNKAYEDGKVAFIPTVYYNRSLSSSGKPDDRRYHAHYSVLGLNNENYTGGKLYSRQNASTGNSGYNRLITVTSDGSEARELAWQLAQTSSAANAGNPGSSTYNGELYTAGYKLYYLDDNGDKQEVDNCTAVYSKDEVSYNGTLYNWENITRTEAAQRAANQFAERLAASDEDTRVAIVGYASNGQIKTSLVPVAENDASENKVNDTIDSAIDGLSHDGGSNLSAGLNKVGEVFEGNKFDNAAERKRIVIVFTDKDVDSSNDALIAANTLKDKYNASVYTVNLGSTNADFLNKLSSNYFYDAQTNGDFYYSATDLPTLYDAYAEVAEHLDNKDITALLTSSNSELRDIISNNFTVDENPTITSSVEEGEYKDGSIEWKNSSANGVSTDWDATNKTLTVKGFDFSANYINETHKGKKVIVTISGLKKNEKVKTDADKRIYTNTADSGIYKTGAEDFFVSALPRPFLDNETMMAPAGGSGVYRDNAKAVVNKYIAPNSNGKYDLTLEAYTTDVNTEVVEKIPTDFVVVVDQSGSMDRNDMPTGYKKVSGTKTLEEIADGSYYIQADDGNYYRVYPTRDYLYRYYPGNYWYIKDLINRFGTRLRWFQANTEAGQTLTNQMYFRETANGKAHYQPITMTVKGSVGAYEIQFSFNSMLTGKEYKFDRDVTTYSSNGNSPWYKNILTGSTMKSGFVWSAANSSVQIAYSNDNSYVYSELGSINTGMYINYPMYDRHVGYTELRYRDVNGVEHTLVAQNGSGQSKWEFCNANGQAITTNSGSTRPAYGNLYQADNTITRLEALQNALASFAETVSTETDDYGSVDNKIAIVGFSSDGFDNNELLTNTSESFSITSSNSWANQGRSSHFSLDGKAHNGIQKDSATTEDYQKALVTVHSDEASNGVDVRITNAIESITAHGGTQPEIGLEMAEEILANRTNTTFTTRTRDPKTYDRNTIVIFFTDGHPGDYEYSNMYAEANEVVQAASSIKRGNTKIFSIGVFGESDGNPLTYTAHQVSSEDASFTYDSGYVDVYHPNNSPYYYLNRNYIAGDAANYGNVANDTIYDYMSVVSSNYPDASNFMNVKTNNVAGEADSSGYTNYEAMVNAVRGDYIGYNEHYRMASSQDTLVSAFAQAITLMNSTISENALLDSAAVLRDILSQNTFVTSDSTLVRTATVDGEMDRNGVVTFDPSTITNVGLSSTLSEADGKTTISVRGFDYLKNYIKYGKKADYEGTGNREHQGKKLVVTITDVYPDEKGAIGPTGDFVKSNEPESAIYVGASPQAKFPEPAITRHSYTLDVGDVNKTATFDVSTAIVSNGTEVDPSDEDLEDVIIVYPNGNRALYSSVGPQTFEAMKGGETFYFENVPSGYMVQTNVTSTDDAYNYSIRFEGEAPVSMKKGIAIPHAYNYADKTIHITSARSNKKVSVWEQTIGSYANTDDVFYEAITMDIPVIDGEDNSGSTYSYDATFNGNPYTAVFTKDASTDGTISTTLTALTPKDGSPSIEFVDGKLPMKHDDRLVIDLPTGNTVKVNEAPNTMDYTVEYYYGQDQVDASAIKLNAADGTALAGTHEVTLVPVNGVDEEPLKVTFSDGHITKIDNRSVTADDKLTLAPYQVVSTDEALSDAILDMDGTRVSFDEETDGNKTAYIATIKRISSTPPVFVTLERNNMDILILNEKGDIPIEGILDFESHNIIIYLLVALGAAAAAGAGIWLWKKKDEFVEE